METLDVRTRGEWRSWLQQNHDSVSAIWLVFHKRASGVVCLEYDDAVEEALCFGWVDSLIKKLDEVRYARKFTPRKPESKWSTINRRRYAQLKSRGLLAAPGLARAPTERSGDAPPRTAFSATPAYVEEKLKTVPDAWRHFQRLAPSYRRAYVGWIDSAKREEKKQRRLREALDLLAAGKTLGLR